MEFDKSKVFSPVDAEELRKGDEVIVADCIEDLRYKVRQNFTPSEISRINSGKYLCRFAVKGDATDYTLAYLVKRVEETKPRYRPFRDTNEFIQAWCDKGGKWQKRELTMPNIWVMYKERGNKELITVFKGDNIISTEFQQVNMQGLFKDFTFLDGSPCGVEE